MEDNPEEEKENYSLLDQKRKDEILLELQKEINDQMLINSKNKVDADNNYNSDINNLNTKELFENNDGIEIAQKQTKANGNYNDLNKNKFNSESNLMFREINNFINENSKNIKSNNKEENKEYGFLPFPKSENNNLILNKQKNLDKEIKFNNEKNEKNLYQNKIKDKKDILFNKKNKAQ